MITVHGTNLDTIQKPEMVVYLDDDPNPLNRSVSHCLVYTIVFSCVPIGYCDPELIAFISVGLLCAKFCTNGVPVSSH